MGHCGLEPWEGGWPGTGTACSLPTDSQKVWRISPVIALYADRTGDLWIGTLEGFFVLRRDQEQIRTVAGMSYTPVAAVSGDDQGTLWVGTMTDGLKFRFQGGMSSFFGESGYPADFIHAVFSDRSGRLWAGTETAGLVRFSRSLVSSITKRDGLPEQGAVCVIEGREGAALDRNAQQRRVCFF